MPWFLKLRIPPGHVDGGGDYSLLFGDRYGRVGAPGKGSNRHGRVTVLDYYGYFVACALLIRVFIPYVFEYAGPRRDAVATKFPSTEVRRPSDCRCDGACAKDVGVDGPALAVLGLARLRPRVMHSTRARGTQWSIAPSVNGVSPLKLRIMVSTRLNSG